MFKVLFFFMRSHKLNLWY